MLGHYDARMTLAIYTHATHGMQDAATAALEETSSSRAFGAPLMFLSHRQVVRTSWVPLARAFGLGGPEASIATLQRVYEGYPLPRVSVGGGYTLS